jgi:segregation and condensation protein B
MATENARAIEAILRVADQPVAPTLLAQLLELKVDDVTAVLDELMASYEVEDRGFILTKVAGGYRYQSHPDLAPYVERFVLEGQSARLSAAALETLAIIAYKQPISRAQVAQVRGVNVDGVVKALEQRGYIAEIGRDPGPGNPSLFGTTDAFLEKLGLASLADLPPIAGFVPGPDVVEQLEQGLRAEIDAETAAYVADLAERADEAAAEEAGEDGEAAVPDAVDGEATVPDAVDGEATGPDAAEPGATGADGSDRTEAVAVEVVESDDALTVEVIDITDAIETDADGEVAETIEVVDDTITLTDDGHVVEVIDSVTETITTTADGDVVDLIDETIVVVADGEVELAAEDVTADAESVEDDDTGDVADQGLDGPSGDGDPDAAPH